MSMVNKKIVYGLVGGLAAVVVAATAWFFLRSKKDAYCNVIPKTAVMVARISPVELFTKNDLTMDDIMKSFGVDKSDKKEIKKFLESGIDFTSAFYLFVNDDASGGLVFGMSDADDLKEYLEKNDNMDVDVDLDKETGYYTVELDKDEVYFCFNDKKALLYVSADRNADVDDVLKLMDQDDDESILDTELYEQLIECDKSMAMNMSVRGALEAIKAQMGSGSRDAKELGVILKTVPDCNMLLAMDIINTEAKATFDIFPNSDDAKKDLDKMMGIASTVSGDLTNCGIKHPLAWCTFAFPGKKIYDGLKKVPFVADELKNIERELDVRGFLSSFNGDVTLALNNDIDGEMPEVLMLAKTENSKYRDVLDYIVEETSGDSERLVSDGGGDYHYVDRHYTTDYDNGYYDYDLEEWVYPESYDDRTMFYIGNSNNCLIATNMTEFKNSVGKSSALDAYKEDIKGCSFFGFIDIHEIFKLVEDKGGMSSSDKKIFKIWKDAKDMTLLVRGTHGEFTFRMDNGTKIIDAFLKTGEAVRDL